MDTPASSPLPLDDEPPTPSFSLQPWLVLGLLVLGGMLWLALPLGRDIGEARWILIILAGFIAALPPVSRRIALLDDWLRTPSQPTRRWTAVTIALLSAVYFVLTAYLQDRDLFPKTHDDCSYVIGAHVLARARLWMPVLPTPDFFETNYILTAPKYCSKYFLGTALFNAPAVWLGVPTWLLPALAAGACVGLLYRITAELLDGTCALLAALFLVSLTWFRTYSILVMANVPTLLMALLLFWAWLKWRQRPRWYWALAMGVFTGWAAITRPIDAIIVALPVAVAVIARLMRENVDAPRKVRRAALTIFAGIAGVLPFIVLHLIFNYGVTGRLTQTPYVYYNERYQPNAFYGFGAIDPDAKVQSTLPIKLDYYDHFVRPRIEWHRPGNLARVWGSKYLPMIVDVTLPSRWLLFLVPVALLGLGEARRQVLWWTLPLFVLFYLPSTFFLEHYAVLIAPAMIVSVLLGVRVLAGTWPRWSQTLFAVVVAGIVITLVTSLWEINRFVAMPGTEVNDETFPSPMLRYVNRELPKRADVQTPAVVLFVYHPGGNYFEEPVYNTDVAWPLDAKIIRAHDLGDRNAELFDYLAKTQPDRTIYRFDWSNTYHQQDPLTRLGTASELGH